jgi:hypothetical protein
MAFPIVDWAIFERPASERQSWCKNLGVLGESWPETLFAARPAFVVTAPSIQSKFLPAGRWDQGALNHHSNSKRLRYLELLAVLLYCTVLLLVALGVTSSLGFLLP